jgi:formate hydrogenlyase subunit 6/NADH:ubiquinone oxidoreductase subunit I
LGLLASIRGTLIATWSGVRHFFKPRMTLKYPEQKLDLEGPGYQYDAKKGVGLPGFKGRHILFEDKCTGCQLCAIACDGVAVAIDMQVLSRKKVQNKKDLWPAVDYGRCVFCGLCVDFNTFVVTNPGLVAISELSIGDKLLTHTGHYKPVTKIWDMRYTGPMYKIYIYGKPDPLICTADHPILAVSRPFSNRKDKRLLRVAKPLEMVKPTKLNSGDYVVSSIVKKIDAVQEFERDVPMYRGGVATGKLRLTADGDLFRLIGYYLAEGSCDGGREVNFDFSKTELTTYAEDCAELVKRFFGKECTLSKNGENGIRLTLYSAIAEDFFSQFGKGAPNKKLPDWAFFAEPVKQLELLKGEWQGDGCLMNQKRQKYLDVTTTSKILAFQLQQIYARLGIVATIDSQQGKGKLRAYHVNVFGRWALKLANLWGIDLDYHPSKHVDKFLIDDSFVYSPIRRIEVEQVRDHRVMDVTIEDDHTFSPAGVVTSNCVDACPFDALFMTNDYELSAYDRESLKFTPEMLMVPPKIIGQTTKVKIDPKKGTATHG